MYHSSLVHDIRALDSKGRCWLVNKSSEFIQWRQIPHFAVQPGEETHCAYYGYHFIASEDFKGLIDSTAFVFSPSGSYAVGFAITCVQWRLENLLAKKGV